MVPQHYTEELLKTFLWQKKKTSPRPFSSHFHFLSVSLLPNLSIYPSLSTCLSINLCISLLFEANFYWKKMTNECNENLGITISNLILAVTFYIWIKLLSLLKRKTTNLLFYQIQLFWNAIKSCHILWIICEIF